VTPAWPSWAAKYSVQTTTNLQNGSWVNIPFSPTLSGTTLNVTIPAPGQSGVYYRLSY